jgi:hypothetical protein
MHIIRRIFILLHWPCLAVIVNHSLHITIVNIVFLISPFVVVIIIAADKEVT